MDDNPSDNFSVLGLPVIYLKNAQQDGSDGDNFSCHNSDWGSISNSAATSPVIRCVSYGLDMVRGDSYQCLSDLNRSAATSPVLRCVSAGGGMVRGDSYQCLADATITMRGDSYQCLADATITDNAASEGYIIYNINVINNINKFYSII